MHGIIKLKFSKEKKRANHLCGKFAISQPHVDMEKFVCILTVSKFGVVWLRSEVHILNNFGFLFKKKFEFEVWTIRLTLDDPELVDNMTVCSPDWTQTNQWIWGLNNLWRNHPKVPIWYQKRRWLKHYRNTVSDKIW